MRGIKARTVLRPPLKISCHVAALAGNMTIRFLGTVHWMPLTVMVPPHTGLAAQVESRVASSMMPSSRICPEAALGSCVCRQNGGQALSTVAALLCALGQHTGDGRLQPQDQEGCALILSADMQGRGFDRLLHGVCHGHHLQQLAVGSCPSILWADVVRGAASASLQQATGV